MNKRIDSRENQTFRMIAALRQTKRSREDGLVFLEGSRLCLDALQSGAEVEYALLADSAAVLPASLAVLDLLPIDCTLLQMPDKLFASLCDTEQPQGIALVCRSPLLDQPAGLPSANGLYLIAEEIQDPGNLGTMIRTADAFAFDAVLLTRGTVYPFNEKVMRAAMGSCFHIPLLTVDDISAAADWLNSSDRPAAILAAVPGAADGLPVDLPLPMALIIGNEAHGLSPEARRICSFQTGIPMPGKAESLNAAAASAILCYEMMRYRFKNGAEVL